MQRELDNEIISKMFGKPYVRKPVDNDDVDYDFTPLGIVGQISKDFKTKIIAVDISDESYAGDGGYLITYEDAETATYAENYAVVAEQFVLNNI
jgi:hypothetical protein